MQDTPPIIHMPPHAADPRVEVDEADESLDRGTLWVSRISRIIGGITLLAALFIWLFHQGHYRLVLVLLVIAMFASIIHAYTFEDGA